MDFALEARSGALYRYDTTATASATTWATPSPTAPPGHSTGARCTSTTRCGATWSAFDFEPESGEISNPREWLRFAPGDGLPERVEAHRCRHRPAVDRPLGRRARRRSRGAAPSWAAACPRATCTNCAFGGPEDAHAICHGAAVPAVARAINGRAARRRVVCLGFRAGTPRRRCSRAVARCDGPYPRSAARHQPISIRLQGAHPSSEAQPRFRYLVLWGTWVRRGASPIGSHRERLPHPPCRRRRRRRPLRRRRRTLRRLPQRPPGAAWSPAAAAT